MAEEKDQADKVQQEDPSQEVSEGPQGPSEKQLMRRRKFAWLCVFGFIGTNLLMAMRFFFPRTLSSPRPGFASALPQISVMGWIPDFSRNIGFGWFATPREFSSSTPSAPIWAARPIGWRAKTNLNAPATAAGTTAKGLISKDLHHGPWTGPGWNSMPRDRSWSMPVSSTNVPREHPAISMTKVLF